MTLSQARQYILDAIRVTISSGDPAAVQLLQKDGDVAFEQFQIDSVAALEFCLEIEDRTGIEIDPGDLVSHPSINALSALLESKGLKDA